jgi:integrase
MSLDSMAPSFFEYAKGFWEDTRNTKGKTPGTIQAKSYTLELLRREFKGKTLTELTPEFLEAYLQNLVDKKLKEYNTVINYLQALNPVFELAVYEKHLTENPLRRVKLEGERRVRVAFDLAEVSAMLFGPGVLNDDGLTYVGALMAASTGMRLGEIQGLQVKHIGTSRSGVLIIHVAQQYWHVTKSVGTTKTKAAVRYVPVIEPLASWLKAQVSEKPPEHFVFSADGKIEGILHQRLFNEHLSKSYKVSLDKAKPRTKTFHSFRHFFNSRMLILTDHNEFLVKALMGQGKQNNMTINYSTATVDKFLDVHKTMEKIFGDRGSSKEAFTPFNTSPPAIETESDDTK